MNNLNKSIRFLPIIGISLTLVGFLYLTYYTYKLNERKENLKLEIAQLELIKSNLTLEAKVKDTVIQLQNNIISQSTDIKTIEKGHEIKKKMIQTNTSTFKLTKKDDSGYSLAQKFELEGFSYLLSKDVEQAIISFRKSENSFNGYHQVYEIAIYLDRNKNELSDKNSDMWKETYITLLKKYSWKMPEDVKNKMVELTK